MLVWTVVVDCCVFGLLVVTCCDWRWATVSGSAGSGAPKSGLAASRHSVMAQKRSVLEDIVGRGVVLQCGFCSYPAIV